MAKLIGGHTLAAAFKAQQVCSGTPNRVDLRVSSEDPDKVIFLPHDNVFLNMSGLPRKARAYNYNPWENPSSPAYPRTIALHGNEGVTT